MASEAGVLDIPPERVERKGRLRPGRMFLVDTKQGRIIRDEELKNELAARQPYREWLRENQVMLAALPTPALSNGHTVAEHANGDGRANGNGHKSGHKSHLLKQQRAFGYTLEDLKVILATMAADGQEAIGSMGNDTPLAILSDRPQPLYN